MNYTPNDRDLPPPGSAPVGLTKKQKITYSAIGFIGFYIFNGLAYGIGFLLLTAANSNGLFAQFGWILSGLPFLINLAALIGFGLYKPTRWIAFGILLAIAFAFTLSIIAGIFLLVYCIVALSGNNVP